MPEAKRPTALISYSHDSAEHEQRVLELCNRLRARGIDAMVDQFLPGAPSEGWPLWMERQIESRDFTLMVCTESYRRRFMEDEAAGVGRGVVWEARILRNLLYEDSERHNRIVPVLVEQDARAFVPTVFRGHFYDLSDQRGFEGLLRHLLREPGAEAASLGSLGPQGSRWSAFERPWLVPDAMRTRYFTGREQLLAALRQELLERRRAALCGLGGVGKTQSALAYALRHRADYPDGVFWVNAETTAHLTNGFLEIAKTLGLTAAASNDVDQVVRAVLGWFDGTGNWLVIFDNVDDRRELASFLPQRGEGHVLLTSRESVFGELGIARALEVVDLGDAESLQFLLERAGRDEADQQERATAAELAGELGNLPLALEQAAAYILETNAAFPDYLKAFRKRRVALLERAGGLVSHEGVAVTWAANFEAVERTSPAAAEVLRVSAFLAPDAIPFEFFSKGATVLGESIVEALAESDELAMTELLRPLARYSLIRLDTKGHAFGLHRLVQEIVRDSLTDSERRSLVERSAGALDTVFPGEVAYANWVECDRLVPHVLAIAGWISAYSFDFATGASMLARSGTYFWQRGRYAEAERLYERTLLVRERALGPEHLEVAESLTGLAMVCNEQGRYDEGESLLKRALAIREGALGPDHPDVASVLNHLGNAFYHRGRHAEARPVYERALAIREGALGPNSPDVAVTLTNLASVYDELGSYTEAEALNRRALATKEAVLGASHPDVAHTLNNLANVFANQGRYAEALPIHERALAIWESALGPDHSRVALSSFNLGAGSEKLGRYADALRYFERALAIWEEGLGPEHAFVGYALAGMGSAYRETGRAADAEPLYLRANAIFERALGPDHQQLAEGLQGLAAVQRALGRYAAAEPLLERALSIRERALGSDNPRLAPVVLEFANLREDQGRNAEALVLFERALAIRQKTFAAEHPELEKIRRNIASLRATELRRSGTGDNPH